MGIVLQRNVNRQKWPIIEDVKLAAYDVVGYIDFLDFGIGDLPLGKKIGKVLNGAGIQVDISIGAGWRVRIIGYEQEPYNDGERLCIAKRFDIEVVERVEANVSVSAKVNGGISVSGEEWSDQGALLSELRARQTIELKQCCCPEFSGWSVVGGQNIDSNGVVRGK